MNEPDGLSRRALLRMGAAAVELAAGQSLLPPSLHTAMAQPMRPGGFKAIEHVVVVMQENRSFDHYYGRLRGVRGYGDRNPLRLQSGRSIFEQPDPRGGDVLPFSLREAAERASRDNDDIQYLGNLDHSFNGSTWAWSQGWNDKWIPAKTPATMTYYDRTDLPLQYELADTFTICDAYHCSVFGSTNPNRNYLWSGTTGYEPGTNQRAVTNAAYSYDHAGYEWPTYPERLEKAGVSWQIYQEWDNFTDNAVEYFQTFKRVGRKVLAGVDGSYRTTEELYDSLAGKSDDEQKRLLAQLEEGRARLADTEVSLFDKAMYRSEPGTLVARLRTDIEQGTLPKVSWLVPPAVDSEHPGASTPVSGANLIYRVLDVIASDPETWSTTALLINFDENDGYFDHVPPPVAPRPLTGNGDDWYNIRPIGLGPRVPMTIVSPWTIGGHVNSEVSDHTSVIQFLEKITGVDEPNFSQWRRAVCGDLTSAFDFDNAGSPPRVARPGTVPAPITRWHPTPPADQALPAQEEGRSPARALPYRPSASAQLTSTGQLNVRLTDAGTTGAPFAIYGHAVEFALPQHVFVASGSTQTITVPVSTGRWDLVIQGPNRFWYELTGSLLGTAGRVDVRARTFARLTSLELRLVNGGDKPVTLDVRSGDYGDAAETVRLGPGQDNSLTWRTDRGWYDLVVTAREDESFRRRLTGRVETGRPGVTA